MSAVARASDGEAGQEVVYLRSRVWTGEACDGVSMLVSPASATLRRESLAVWPPYRRVTLIQHLEFSHTAMN